MAYFSPRQNLRATSLQLEVRKIAEQSFILSDKLLYLLTTWLGVERELCPKVLSACLSWYGTTTSQTLARATKPQYSQHSTPKVGHCPTGGDWDLASASGSWEARCGIQKTFSSWEESPPTGSRGKGRLCSRLQHLEWSLHLAEQES